MKELERTYNSRGGRPQKFNEEQRDQIITMFNEGKTENYIAWKMDCSLPTVQRVIRQRRNGIA